MKRNALFLLSFLPFLLLGQGKQKVEEIDGILNDYYANDKFQGAALVAENNRVIYQKGFGKANINQAIPNETDVKFQVGSVTKQFTAMLILQLVEQQKINLQNTITDYLPDFRRDIGEQVTIHQLLSHTSGIPNYTCHPRFFNLSQHYPYKPDEFITTFCSGDLAFQPGSRFQYSNSGYFILGHLIEQVTNNTYEEVLQNNIFKPAKMYDSGYEINYSATKKRAVGYHRLENSLHKVGFTNSTIPFAAGAIYSTAHDLFKWDKALRFNHLLSSEYKDLLFTPNRKSYGYGWMIKKYKQPNGKQTRVVMHGGSIDGFRSLIIRFLDDNKLIILLNNTDNADLNNLSQAITKVLYV